MPGGYIESDRKKLLARLAKKVDQAKHERDMAIMEAVEAGISLQAIATCVELSHSTVRDLARRKRQELDGKPKTSRRQEQQPGRRPAIPPPRYGWSDPPPPGWEKP